MEHSEDQAISIVYTNYRGLTATRHIIPAKIWFSTTKYHPQPQWIIDAYDLDKQADRSFSLADIKSWQTPPKPV